jgi:hypothetical protein
MTHGEFEDSYIHLIIEETEELAYKTLVSNIEKDRKWDLLANEKYCANEINKDIDEEERENKRINGLHDTLIKNIKFIISYPIEKGHLTTFIRNA